MDVEIHIVTNNNKVYRLMVCDAHTTNEAGIKIRFNNLVYQFQNNIRYETIGSEDQTISDNEDISYGMTFQAKNYDALFYQKPIVELDSVELKSLVKERLYSMLTEEQLKDTVSGAYSELISAMAQYVALELRTQKLVWFRIIKDYDQYYIAMYYDNKYNEANGEDL